MRIAVASDGLDVSKHGSRCASYTCYTVDRGIITACQNTPNPCLALPLNANYLQRLGVDVYIARKVEPQLRELLEDLGIDVIEGARGSTRDAAEAYLARLFSGSDLSADEDELDVPTA